MKNKKKKSKEKESVESVHQDQTSGRSVARVTEIIASSPVSFDDAVRVGVARACQTLENVTSAWVQDQKVDIVNGQISAYRVAMKVTFVLKEA